MRLKPLAAHIRRVLFPSLVLGLQVGSAVAGPEGGNVVGGSGSIARPDANTTVINQQSHNLAIDWQKFNVKSNELVQFNQPGRNAQALNRIFDQNASQIHGRINANGRVLLMNPNGVIFGRNSHVNVNGLVAAGMKNIPVDDFMAGKFKLEALDGADGAVVNHGTLEAATGGDITLVGKSIRNEGIIIASAGRVNLAAGNKVTLDFDGDGLMRFAVDEQVLENAQALDDQISNTGSIEADGGDVIIAASAAQNVFTNAINNDGVVRAGRIENSGGTIRLVGMGPSASVLNTGLIDASAADTVSSGGYVDITGANIRQGGVIRANATAAGGSVSLVSSGQTIADASSQTTVTSTSAVGGTVHMLGDQVGLFGASAVDASGATGGGEVLIGGDFQGKTPDVPNAKQTVVDSDAEIRANATDTGDGGKVIVWADESTVFAGEIEARGGAKGGDGGFVETSGKQYLLAIGSADASAPQGKGGDWLLDPTDVTLDALDPEGMDDSINGTFGGGGTFTPDPTATATADTQVLEDALEAGTNVIINTTSGGGGNGDIIVDTAITVTGGVADLTLNAERNLTFNAGANFDASASAVDLMLNFGQANGGGILDFGGVSITADSLVIAGGTGTDTIIGPNAVNTWTSTADNAGTLVSANFTVTADPTFTTVENLTGGTAADTMNIGDAFTNIDGGLGADMINITAGGLGSVTGNAGGDIITIDSDPGFNVLGGADGDTININVSLANAVMGEAGNDMFVIGAAGVIVIGGVDGGSESDTVVGPNAVNIWNITASDAADLTGGSAFTTVEALTGGAMADTFNVATAIGWTGALNGAAGDDVFNIADGATVTTIDGGTSATGDTIDWSLETGVLTVTATALTAPVATGEGFDGTATGPGATSFSGIEEVVGNGVATSSLQGPDLTNIWTIDDVNDGNVLADNSVNPARTLTFTNFPDLTGGSGADTFQISGIGTINSVAGGGGTDTLAGGATNNTWNITPGGGSVFDNDNTNFDVVVFSSISVLRGNSMDDAFRFTSGTSIATIDGGATGASGDILDFDTGNFNAAITATLTAESATDGFTGAVGVIVTSFSNINDVTGDVDFASNNALVGNIGTGGTFNLITGVYTSTAGPETLDFTNFTSFTGGTGEDIFIFADAATTYTITGGGGGTNTLDLSADATDLTFTIDGGDDGTVGSIAFTDVGNLTSGSGDDTFALDSAGSVSGTLDAGAMNATGDVLDFNANDFNAVVTVTFTGESATDGLSGSVNTNDVTGFANINSVIGDVDFSNDLVGDIATGGTFDLTASTYTSTSGPETVSFSADFVSFTGGGGEDTFTFTDATTTYTIDGGSAGTDTLNLSADATALTFAIDGADDGTVGMITFTDVGNLTSGAGDDVFNLDNDGATTFGSISGTITANGGATNAISWAAASTAISVTLSAESGTGFAGGATGNASVANFSQIHDVTGTGQSDTLTGTNSGGTFLIDDQGTSQDYTETNTVTFTSFENLSGGTGGDVFNIQTDGSSTLGTVVHTGTLDGGGGGDSYIFTNDAELAGTITDTGGGGTDVIDVSGTLMDVNDNPDGGVIVSRINLKAAGNGETDSINNGGEPSNINSGAGQDDFAGIEDVDAPVLFADPTGSIFEITADGTVIRDGEPAETGILQIVGAADNFDVFIFDDIAQLAGIGGVGIIGGDITLGTEFEDRIEIRNTSTNITTAQFDINGIDSGSITIDGKTTTFVGVESLLGLDGIGDLFNFTGSGFIRGQIDGRGGSDTADYSAVTNGLAFTIALDETITPALLSDTQSGVVSVETLTGQATNPELFTIAGGSDFTLNAAQTDAGSVTGTGGTPTMASFTNWGNLTGTGAADSFTFSAGSMISGSIDGLAGADTIDIDLIAGAQTITLTNSSADNGTTTGGYDGTIGTLITGFSNVTVLVGTGNGDELIGDDVAATWTLDGGVETYATNAGGDPDFTFSNVSDLTGGSAVDTFDLDADVAGTVAGGAGNDAFNVNVSLATATLQGGDDSDTFTLADSVIVTNTIDGGSGGSNVDELEGAATLATTFNLTADGVGNVAIGATATYTDIENLTGRGGADTFNVSGSHAGDLAGGGANDDFNFDANTLTGNVSGDGGDDTFDFNGGDVVGTLAGGGNTGAGDTLDFAGVGVPVVIDLGDSGTDMGVTLGSGGFTGAAGNGFTGIENYIGTAFADTLIGTTDADVFNVTANNGGNINGVATATFASFETLMGEGNDDQFNISNTFSVSDVQGGLGNDLLNMSAYLTDLAFTLNGANGSGSVTAPAMVFSGIEDFSSGSGNDIYTVSNAASIDLGTLPSVASIDGGPHTTFDQINFTSGTDTIVAIANIPNIERISSSGASDTLVGQAGAELFQTTDMDDGTVDASLAYTDFENLDGADGNDTFQIDDDITGTVQGGNDSDSFFIINTAAVSVGGLDGGAGADTFQIGQNFSAAAPGDVADVTVMLTAPMITGGNGADVFDFREGSTLVGSVDGTDGNAGGVTDTITIAFSTLGQEVITAPGTIPGSLMGTIKDFPTGPVLPDLISGTFDNIVTIIGNNLGTLVGPNQANDWQITGVDTGTLNGSMFTNFSLLGGTLVDTFTFQAGGQITGDVRGGADAVADVVVSAVAGAHFHIDANVDGRIVLDPPLGAATLITSFFDIDALRGTAGGVETFFVDAAWTGTLDGAGGGATIDFVNGPVPSLGTQNLVLTGVGSAPIGVSGSTTNVGGFDNITTIINAGPGSVTGPNFDTAFTINAGGTSTVAIDDTVNIGTVTVSVLGNLIGGMAADTFTVNTSFTGSMFGNAGNDRFVLVSGSVSGTADGGADVDTLDYTTGAYGAALNVVINGPGTGAGGNGFAGFESGAFSLSAFNNINTILGRGGADNLTAPNTPNIWTITGTSAFTLNGVMFNGFTNATGNLDTDDFTIVDGGFTFGGTVNGAGALIL